MLFSQNGSRREFTGHKSPPPPDRLTYLDRSQPSAAEFVGDVVLLALAVGVGAAAGLGILGREAIARLRD